MWNRIRSAAEWVPSDTATETDVAEGKTFHNTSRIQKIGSASLAPDYGKQSLATKMELQSMYTQEESVWDDVAGSPFATYEAVNLKTGQVKKDIRTGLWWTAPSASPLSNVFTLASDGQRPTGGNAIAFCEALNTANFAGNNVWYLPTEKELMQAYVDGIYSQDHTFGNLTSAPWAPETWSSTDSIYDGFAVAGALYTPSFGSKNKTDTLSVRCVRRD